MDLQDLADFRDSPFRFISGERFQDLQSLYDGRKGERHSISLYATLFYILRHTLDETGIVVKKKSTQFRNP